MDHKPKYVNDFVSTIHISLRRLQLLDRQLTLKEYFILLEHAARIKRAHNKYAKHAWEPHEY